MTVSGLWNERNREYSVPPIGNLECRKSQTARDEKSLMAVVLVPSLLCGMVPVSYQNYGV